LLNAQPSKQISSELFSCFANHSPALPAQSRKRFLMLLESLATLPSLGSTAWLILEFAVEMTAAVERVLVVTHSAWSLGRYVGQIESRFADYF
jgi:hypothetical protein